MAQKETLMHVILNKWVLPNVQNEVPWNNHWVVNPAPKTNSGHAPSINGISQMCETKSPGIIIGWSIRHSKWILSLLATPANSHFEVRGGGRGAGHFLRLTWIHLEVARLFSTYCDSLKFTCANFGSLSSHTHSRRGAFL
jgi:hypothetical protein